MLNINDTFAGSWQSARGFTLIEIVLVIVIMSVMTMMIAPSFFSATGTTVAQQTRRLAQALRLGVDEAVLTGRPIRWSAQAHGYNFASADGEGAWQLLDESPFASYTLPAGMRIVEVQPVDNSLTEKAGKKGSEPVMARLLLMPEGIAQPASITLAEQDGSGDRLTIRLRPGPGGVVIDKEQN
ncbi:MAG: GspH/FimT family pseudopilin [Mariprofundus sp.]